VGQDLETEVRSLSSQAIAASFSRSVTSRPKGADSGLKFYAPEELRKDAGPTVGFLQMNSDGTRESDSFRYLRDGAPGFFLQAQKQRGTDWVAEVSLAAWVKKLAVGIQPGAPILIALMPLNQLNQYETPVVVFDHLGPEANRVYLPRLMNEASRVGIGDTSLSVDGQGFVLRQHKIPRVGTLNPKKDSDYWARLTVFVPHSYIYRQWWSSFWLVMMALAIVTIVGPILVLGSLRRQFVGLQQTIEEVRGVGKGQAGKSTLANEGPYLAAIADEFMIMARILSEQQLRARAMNRVISELAECSEQKAVIARAVELIGTQCRAEITVFVPAVGNTGIIWQNHKLLEIELAELTDLINKKPSNQRLTFQIRPGPSTLGFITAIFAEPLSEIIESLTHLVFGQIDNALNRLLALERVSEERAKSRLLSQLKHVEGSQFTSQSQSGQVATYLRSVDEHPSGWVEYIECANHRVIVTLGNLRIDTVLAHIVAMNIRSSVKSIGSLVSETGNISAWDIGKIEAIFEAVLFEQFKVPRDRCEFIIGLLDRKDGQLQILNHEFPKPLLVTQGATGNSVVAIGAESQVAQLTLPRQGSIVFYSDSINGTHNLRAGIFQRLLHRGLEQTAVPVGQAPQIRDEIAALWNYYVQQSSGYERVHILCLSTGQSMGHIEGPGTGSAA
jgi:hypothetical protein